MDGHLWNRLAAAGPHALLVADGHRGRVDGNDAALELLGLSREELRARRLEEIADDLRALLSSNGHQVSIWVAQPGAHELTAREREVVACIAEGETTDEIARRLFISRTTVDTHVRKAMARLGAKNRAHLIALALLAGEI